MTRKECDVMDVRLLSRMGGINYEIIATLFPPFPHSPIMNILSIILPISSS